MYRNILLFTWIVIFSIAANAKDPLVITVVTKGSFTEASKNILKEAYRRIDVPVVFREFPGERALISTSEGQTDGELFRIDKINLRYPNLIQIPASYIPDEVAVFSKIEIALNGWESLKPFTTAVRTGDKFVEEKTKGMTRQFTTQDLQSFQMLELDRVQVVIASRWDGLEYVKAIGSKTIKALSPSIVTNPLYHYLHYQHAEIVPRLTVAIQDMHQDGSISRILNEAKTSIFE